MTEVIYPFNIEVTLKGIRWQVTGTAVLEVELGTVYTEAGLIAIEHVDRLCPDGSLDYGDIDWNLWYPEERLALVGALEIKINNRPDIETYFWERQEP